MRMMSVAFRLAAPIFIIVGFLHLVFGVGAEVMLGAGIPAEALTDPVLDSQNRFYGVAFTVYGFLLWHCASDLEKYRTVVQILLWVFLAAGCARLVSIATHGWPDTLVLALLATELLLPPVCLIWLARSTDASAGSGQDR